MSQHTRHGFVEGKLTAIPFNYFDPGTKVVVVEEFEDDCPLVSGREYVIESCDGDKPVCKVTQYHWPLDTNMLRSAP